MMSQAKAGAIAPLKDMDQDSQEVADTVQEGEGCTGGLTEDEEVANGTTSAVLQLASTNLTKDISKVEAIHSKPLKPHHLHLDRATS